MDKYASDHLRTDRMKALIYNFREFDEGEYFRRYACDMGIELGYTELSLSPESCDLAKGYDAVSITPSPLTAPMLDRLKEIGVRMVCTRCIGYDHIDIAHAKKIGMIVSHITYDPDGVAEYTVMGMLMVVRRVKEIIAQTMANDFRYRGLLSRELKDLSVGVIGAGRIGTAVLRDLSGFGCRLYYYDRERKDDAERFAERLELNDLLSRCDVISIHLELNDFTRHIIDEDAFGMMKKGTVFVNTARGPLADTEALISALRSGHLGGAMIDVVEDEFGYYYEDCRDKDMSGHFIGILREMPNVVLTHHMAFYYESAVRDRVLNCLLSIKAFFDGEDIPLRLV